jgi:beta-lactamase superfamily II metal-dependent hydrolase
MGTAGTIPVANLAAAKRLDLADDALALFVLNVGDGDSLVLRFPDDGGGVSFAVVDCFDADKTLALLSALGATSLRFVCATHPHFDHIKGLRAVLQAFRGQVGEFWDSGFRFTSKTYHKLIREVEDQRIRFIRPTSGFEVRIGAARVTVLSPSIYLRNRYDTYGVDVNNASVVLRVSYPERPPSTDYPSTATTTGGNAAGRDDATTRAMILGGDAQTDAWGRVLDEFPHFHLDDANWARQIRARSGRQPLYCDLLKVSHHGSKRGINLELVERLGDSTGSGPSNGPRALVISSDTGEGSTHGFPHAVTQALLREVRDPQARGGAAHDSDANLGIHVTAQAIDPTGGPAGSVAFVVSGDGKRRLYRMGDAITEPVDLSAARMDKKIR